MNLAETIKQMGRPQESLDEGSLATAGKEIAKIKDPINKKELSSIGQLLQNLERQSILQKGSTLAKLGAQIQSLDTDVREVVMGILKKHKLFEEITEEDLEVLGEAMVRGKEVFDKTFANKTQADNFAKKNGGRVKQVGRVFYVFKESPEDDMPPSSDEKSMALRQAEFIQYVGEEIEEFIEKEKAFPEWLQNKLTELHTKAEDVHTAMAGEYKDDEDEEELDEIKRKYDKNNDFRLLNRLAQKEKSGQKLTDAEKRNKANAERRLRNHGVMEEVELDENKNLIKDYQDMKAQGKKDSNILDALMSMPKYKRMSKDQMAKIIGDAKRKGIFKEEVELEEDFYTVVYRDKKGKVQGEKEFDTKSAAEKYAKLGNSRDKVGGKYTVTLVRDGGMGRRNEEVELDESVDFDALFESAFEEEKLSLEDTLKAIWEGKMDKVDPKALKKDFKDRKDKDIDNDGDVDDSDEYLHNRRKAVKKAMSNDSDKAEKDQEKEVSDKEDEPKGKVGKSNKQTKVEVNPSIEEEKGEEMTSAEMEKRDEIMKSLEKKKDEFVKKYGDRAKEVMARTAIKMAKKHA